MTELKNNRNKTEEQMKELYKVRAADVKARKLRAVQVVEVTKKIWYCPACHSTGFEAIEGDMPNKEEAIVKCIRCGHESKVSQLRFYHDGELAKFETLNREYHKNIMAQEWD